jgi:hypothetical protein
LSTPVKPVVALEVSETADTDAPAAVDDEFTEYDEYTEHDELGDGEYGEIPFNDDNLQGAVPVVQHRQSETPYPSDSAGTEGVTSDLLELVPDVEHFTGGFSISNCGDHFNHFCFTQGLKVILT